VLNLGCAGIEEVHKYPESWLVRERKRLESSASVVDAGRPAGSSSPIVSGVESGVSVHGLRQVALSATTVEATAGAGSAVRRSGEGRNRSRDGRSRWKRHHGRGRTSVAWLDLSHVFDGGEKVLDANHDEHETNEQNNILNDPVDEWNDHVSQISAIIQRPLILVIELIVEVMYAASRVKDHVERDEYRPGQQVVSRRHFI